MTPVTLLAGPVALAAALIGAAFLPAYRIRKLTILDALRGT